MKHADSADQAGADAAPLIFEHPLSERVRSFLRLEAVLAETHRRVAYPEPEINRAALASLIELAALAERGELKREVLTELDRQRLSLAPLQDTSGVDPKRLRNALGALEQEQARVESTPERPGQNLRANEFLASVRARSTIPGGTCAFDLPALHCWLARPQEERHKDLERLLSELAPLEWALALLLRHMREAGQALEVIAAGGIYDYMPPSENAPVLLRIGVPAKSAIFPLVSAGKHRITIQFQRWLGIDSRPETLRRDVHFSLALCRL
ncbi:MAG TPA: cell division protein ZapD [Gammaproteobacteria bacterium]|nr:cell division protein ZapD [Gammaproteobacteria bacterium]